MSISRLVILMIPLLNCIISGPRGEIAKTWQHGAVVFAKVVAFEKSGFGGTFKLMPLATLSGDFDPAFHGEVSAGALIGNLETTVIQDAPNVGKRVNVFLNRDINGDFQIPNGDATFFPAIIGTSDRPCIFEVTGFDDPKVTETIENLRKIRGKQREEAEKAKADKPKSAQNPAVEKK